MLFNSFGFESEDDDIVIGDNETAEDAAEDAEDTGSAETEGAASADDIVSVASNAADIIEKAVADLKEAAEDAAEEGEEVSNESAIRFAATVQAVSQVLGMPASATVGLESALSSRNVVSLEAEGESLWKRIWTAIKNAVASMKAALIKAYDRIFDTGMRLARHATKLKEKTEKLDKTKNKTFINAGLSKAYRTLSLKSGDVSTSLKHAITLTSVDTLLGDAVAVTKAAEATDNAPPAKIETLTDAMGAASNKLMEHGLVSLGLKANGGRWASPVIIHGKSLQGVAEIQHGESLIFKNVKLKKLISLGVTTQATKTDFSKGSIIMPSSSDANKILDDIIKLGNSITVNKRQITKFMDDANAQFKNDKKAADGDALTALKAKQVVYNLVMRVINGVFRAGAGLSLSAAAAGLSYVNSAISAA